MPTKPDWTWIQCNCCFELLPAYTKHCSNCNALVYQIDSKSLQRFRAKVRKTDTCWFWEGAITGTSYGCFKVGSNGKTMAAHRVALLTEGEPIPEGMVVMHTCDHGLCVNPAHLVITTSKENRLDYERKQRQNPQIREKIHRNLHRVDGRLVLSSQ